MKLTEIALILLIVIFQSCSNEDCDSCFTPPESFRLELIDRESGENLLTNGTYKPKDLTLTDVLNNNEAVEFTFLSENDTNLIHIGSIGWETEIVNLKMAVSGTPVFELYVDAERKTDACCSFTEYNKITITHSEFELNTQTGIYRVFVE